MLTVLADENIAHLDTYFKQYPNVHLITRAGRAINGQAIEKYAPDALLIRSVTPINADTIHPKSISFVGSATIGTDHVDEQFLQQHNIAFANAKGCSKHSVAQYVLTAIFHIHPKVIQKTPTLGIIGLGNIGSTLAQYAQDLGWRVRGHDPYLPHSTINNSTLCDLLSHSDIISIHTPLTKTGDYSTYGLINQDTLSHLKAGTILINTARGEIIRQSDLIDSIQQKQLSVVLDVFLHEPIIDKALLDALTIATPHIAGYTLEGKLRGTQMIYEAFCQHFNLPIVQQMQNLLPNNPYNWQALKHALLTGDAKALNAYYDIGADDAKLRACAKPYGVVGQDFDELRKNYPLKREWYYEFP